MLTSSELESHDTYFILELEDSYGMRISPGPSNIRMIVLQMGTNRNAHVHNEVSETISCGKPFLLTAFLRYTKHRSQTLLQYYLC